jgi:prophage antirepressor-like protein
MNQMQLFNFGTEQVRVSVADDNKLLFCASDVTKILGYANGADAIIKHCSSKGVAKRDTLTKGGNQSLTYISEGNLYRLVAKSNKPEAEKFEEWIFDEVVPTIRKHGLYATETFVEKALSDPSAMISVLTELKNERHQRQLAESNARVAESKAMLMEQINIDNKPKVLFADSVATSKSSILVGELAKLIKQNGVDMGANRLFEYLRENGFLIKRKGTDFNMPTQKAMELGLFEIKERTIDNPDGTIRLTKTPKVTGKGQVFFVNHFLRLYKPEKIEA